MIHRLKAVYTSAPDPYIQLDSIVLIVQVIEKLQDYKKEFQTINNNLISGKEQLKENQSVQVASELATLHFELASILDKCYDEPQTLKVLTITDVVNDLRETIGKSALEVDKLSVAQDVKNLEILQNMSAVEKPLMCLQEVLNNESFTSDEQPLLFTLKEPLEK